MTKSHTDISDNNSVFLVKREELFITFFLIMCILFQITDQNIVNTKGIPDISILCNLHRVIRIVIITKLFVITILGFYRLAVHRITHFISEYFF